MNASLSGFVLLGVLGQQSAGAAGAARFEVPPELLRHPGLVPNASFEAGQDAPAEWKQQGAQGGGWTGRARTGRRAIGVGGTANDSNYWRCTGLNLAPRTVYRFSAHMRTAPGVGGGCLIMGPSSNNRDYGPVENWTRRGFVFVTPDNTNDVFLRCGRWRVPGMVWFDDLCLRSVVPIYSTVGSLVLGEGERIVNGRYVAAPNLKGEGSNEFRGLVSHTAHFNSYRWVFGPGRTVTYEHRVGNAAQTSGKISVSIGYYQSGALHVAASKDGKTWTEVGQLSKQGSKEMTVPTSIYPTTSLWVRLRASGGHDAKGDSAPGNLQVYTYRYEADLAGEVPDATGSTSYLDVLTDDAKLGVTVDRVKGAESGSPSVSGRLKPAAGAGLDKATLRLTLSRKGKIEADVQKDVKLDAGKQTAFELPFRLGSAGAYDLILAAGDADGRLRFAAKTSVSLPILHAADYGYLIQSDGRGELWWCEGTYKVSRHRPAPQTKGKPIHIVAAGNEYEPFQFVLRPRAELKRVEVVVSDLTGPAGRIDKANVDVDRVAWVHVSSPTDRVGCVGDWPDPLPHWDRPFDVPANTNQPIWITVYVPPDTKPGEYKGTVTVRAGGDVRYRVPVSLRVLGFSLPKEAHVFATFGFGLPNIRKYHNLETDDELRQVFDLYMKNFAAHRISPYDPMALDPMRMKVDTGLGWHGGQRVKDTKASGSQSLLITDDDAEADVVARTVELIPIDPKAAYVLRWQVKTDKPDQAYMVSVYHSNKARRWIAYHNYDIHMTGSGQWQKCERVVKGRAPVDARYVSIVLRPTRWTESGEHMGKAWFDDVSFKRADGGPELVKDPGFEITDAKTDVNVDFTAFDRAARRYLDGLGFTAFRLRVEGMGWGTFHSRHKGSIGGH